MIFLLILFIVFPVSDQWICNFDSGQTCLKGLQLNSFILLLNQTNEEIRQPASDVTAILTSNDEGECLFPYKIDSFEMYFCQKIDPNLPSTCPLSNGNGSTINCTEGEYGYELFEKGEKGSRSYELESLENLSIGEHCIELFYYLSDEISNGILKVILEDNQNQTILIASTYEGNKWHKIKQNFQTFHSNLKIFFLFERQSANSNRFYIGIDQITISDIHKNISFLEPRITTTTMGKNSFITSPISTMINNLLTTINSTDSNTETTNISYSSESSTNVFYRINSTKKSFSSASLISYNFFIINLFQLIVQFFLVKK